LRGFKTSGRATLGKNKERGVAEGERAEIPSEGEGRHNPDLGRAMALFCTQSRLQKVESQQTYIAINPGSKPK
jgi:hypothetical protein